MAGELKRREETSAKKKLLDQLPEAVRNKVLALEAEYIKRPDAVAVCLQLSGLYKDLNLKDFAVEYLQKAINLDPTNNFLQQKMQLLVDGTTGDKLATVRLDREIAATRKSVHIFIAVAAAAVLVVTALLVKTFAFPATFCLAPVEGERETLSPRFSSDSGKIAYIDQPKFTIFGMVEAMATREEKGESWLMVKPIKGKATKVARIGKGRTYRIDFDWRPKHDELTFVSFSLTQSDENPYGIYHVAVAGGEPKLLANAQEFAWSYDGRYLAYQQESWFDSDKKSGLYILDMDSGQSRLISNLDCSEPSWSPGSLELVFRGNTPWRQRYDSLEDLIAQPNEADEQAVVRDNIAGDIYHYDLASDTLLRLTEDGLFRMPQFTPDGLRIAAIRQTSLSESGNTLVLLKSGGFEILLAPGGAFDFFGAYSFAPDGRTLAFEGYFPSGIAQPQMPPGMADVMPAGQNYVSDIFTVNMDGANLQRLKSSRHKFKSMPVNSPDGALLAFEVMHVDFRHEIWAMKR